MTSQADWYLKTQKQEMKKAIEMWFEYYSLHASEQRSNDRQRKTINNRR